jgi:hypothetical protein
VSADEVHRPAVSLRADGVRAAAGGVRVSFLPYQYRLRHDLPYGKCACFNTPPEFQNFWRCAHHPSAIANYFAKRIVCENGCHAAELHWQDNGFHQLRGESQC